MLRGGSSMYVFHIYVALYSLVAWIYADVEGGVLMA